MAIPSSAPAIHDEASEAEPAADESLSAALAQECRSAPWYLTSAAVHSLLFLLLLVWPYDLKPFIPKSPVIIEWEERQEEIVQEPVIREEEPPVILDSVPVTEPIPDLVMEDIQIDVEVMTDNDAQADEARGNPESVSLDEAVSDAPQFMPFVDGMPPGGAKNPYGRPDSPGSRAQRIRQAIHSNPRPILDSTESALRWLAEHQEADGHWDCAKYGGGPHDVAVTSLALLAFLGNGHTTRLGEHRKVVQRAVYWLEQQQDASGRIGPHRYEAGLSLMAMADAYGMSQIRGAGDPNLRRIAQRCVDWAVQAQCPAGGFDYTPASSRNDTSVFGWWIMGLKSARVAGLQVPYAAFDKALKYIQAATLAREDYGASVSYASTAETAAGVKCGGGSSRLTAVALTCLQFLGRPRSDAQVAACATQGIRDGLPTAAASDFYRWYYAALGFFQYGLGTQEWQRFSQSLFETLTKTQVQAGTVRENKGSWNYEAEHFGNRWGRVGQTALGALMLEFVYRYDDVHRKKDGARL